MNHDVATHELRVAEAAAQVRQAAGATLALAKRTSNLFRERAAAPRHRVDLGALCHVLDFDATGGWCDVEGMCTYEDFVTSTLLHGRMPSVVPQFKTITVGGAAAGIGVEGTSFRHGLVHDTLLEMDVLLPGGDVVTCGPRGEHSDLFHGFANSYGTLGYAVRLRACTLAVQPGVHVRHRRFARPEAYIEALREACAGEADFVDGVVFAPDCHVLCVGRFTAEAPWRSDYGYHDIYWQSLLQRDEDYLGTADWLWRWDTDCFWCSNSFGAKHLLVRWMLGRERLNARTYTRWMRFDARWRLAARLARWRGRSRESVIQGLAIPVDRAAEFLGFVARELGIRPVWICPVRGEHPDRQFPLFRLPAPLYVSFGFWGAVVRRGRFEPGHYNRLIEREVLRLGGIKSLYSDSWFTREEFDAAYGREAYERLKAKYDPQRRAPGLYEKCVKRA